MCGCVRPYNHADGFAGPDQPNRRRDYRLLLRLGRLGGGNRDRGDLAGWRSSTPRQRQAFRVAAVCGGARHHTC